MKKIDLIGNRFGKLVVTAQSEKYGNRGQIKWLCVCDCGSKTTVLGTSLRRGSTKSCGCLKTLSGEMAYGWKGGKSVSGGRCTIRIGKKKYLEHRIIAEKAAGLKIKKNAVVHHIDGDATNNSKNNLVICEDRAYHNLIHKRMRALKVCGHSDWLLCCYCKQYDSPTSLHFDVIGRHVRHVDCHKKYMKEYHIKTGR